ncbi:hypothetical protein FRB96_002603 [Tulasnella sp. 330]|nr:hypothetical protein FRB96_002603 [Tulasnella sp. 330]
MASFYEEEDLSDKAKSNPMGLGITCGIRIFSGTNDTSTGSRIYDITGDSANLIEESKQPSWEMAEDNDSVETAPPASTTVEPIELKAPPNTGRSSSPKNSILKKSGVKLKGKRKSINANGDVQNAAPSDDVDDENIKTEEGSCCMRHLPALEHLKL